MRKRATTAWSIVAVLLVLVTTVNGTFLKHLNAQERTIDRYIQYFIGLVNGSDDSVEQFMEQRRASPELKRLLTKRQREMQERRRMSIMAMPPPMYGNPMMPMQQQQQQQAQPPRMPTGDAQWNIIPERGDLEELRETVGDRLLSCLVRDRSYPRDVRDTIRHYITTEPMMRRRGDLEELQMDDPRAASRSTAKTCLIRFEHDLIAFLRRVSDEDGENYLSRFQRLLRSSGSVAPWSRRRATDYDSDPDYDDDDDDDDAWPWWLYLLIASLLLALVASIAYGLYWFFRKRRLERRAIIAATAAGVATGTGSA